MPNAILEFYCVHEISNSRKAAAFQNLKKPDLYHARE